MTLHDLGLLLIGAFLEVAATVAIVFFPELVDCLLSLIGTDGWPGEG